MALQTILENIKDNLESIAPTLAVILIIMAGFVYGFAQIQPGESRGKYTNIAFNLLVGGVIIMAITFGASVITNTAKGILT